jgi:hypothetical protein
MPLIDNPRYPHNGKIDEVTGVQAVMLVSDSSTVWSLSQTSTAATAQTVTRAAEVGNTHRVQGFEVVIGGADTTVAIAITLRAGATVIWRTRFGPVAKQGDRVGVMFPQALVAAENEAVSLEVGAGSAGVVTDANLAGMTG